MFAAVKARDVDVDAADVMVLEPKRFDAEKRPLEPARVSIEMHELSLVIAVDDWAKLVRRVNEALAKSGRVPVGEERT